MVDHPMVDIQIACHAPGRDIRLVMASRSGGGQGYHPSRVGTPPKHTQLAQELLFGSLGYHLLYGVQLCIQQCVYMRMNAWIFARVHKRIGRIGSIVSIWK